MIYKRVYKIWIFILHYVENYNNNDEIILIILIKLD